MYLANFSLQYKYACDPCFKFNLQYIEFYFKF